MTLEQAVINIVFAPLLGALFIGLFMRLFGKYSWLRSIAVGVVVSVSAFVLFEIWFTIPLPKGPLEEWLGY